MLTGSCKTCALAVFFIGLLGGISHASAKDLYASLPYLPAILESEQQQDGFVALVRALDEAYSEGSIQFKIYPFMRSLNNVTRGKADFHLPMIKHPDPHFPRPYAYVSEKLGDVTFVLYTQRDNPLSVEQLNAATASGHFPYKIETDQALVDYFDFPCLPSKSLEQSLKKVSIQRIDGFLWAQEEGDITLRKMGVKNVHRSLYRNFDDVIIIPKGDKQAELDQALSAAIKHLRSSGELEKIHRSIHQPYIEWQVY